MERESHMANGQYGEALFKSPLNSFYLSGEMLTCFLNFPSASGQLEQMDVHPWAHTYTMYM